MNSLRRQTTEAFNRQAIVYDSLKEISDLPTNGTVVVYPADSVPSIRKLIRKGLDDETAEKTNETLVLLSSRIRDLMNERGSGAADTLISSDPASLWQTQWEVQFERGSEVGVKMYVNNVNTDFCTQKVYTKRYDNPEGTFDPSVKDSMLEAMVSYIF